MADLTPLAGLNVAPPYDQSKELDPQSVQPMPTPFDVEKLEYFQKRQDRRTWYARVTLLTALVFLVGLDIWSSTVQHEATIAELAIIRSEQLSNIDQARLGQVELQELTEAQIVELEETIAGLRQQLEAQGVEPETATATAAE